MNEIQSLSEQSAHLALAELVKRRAEVQRQISQIESSMPRKKPHGNVGKPSKFSKLEQAKDVSSLISAGMGLKAACERVGVSAVTYLKHFPPTLACQQLKEQQARAAHAKILRGVGVVQACKESGLTHPVYYKYRTRGLFAD